MTADTQAQGDLAPCPFCGKRAHFFKITDVDQRDFGGEGICCDTEGCATIGLRFACMEDVKPLLAEQWNNRAAALQGRGTQEVDRSANVQGQPVDKSPEMQGLGTQEGEPSDERVTFEAWIARDGGDLRTFGSDPNRHYHNSAVNNAWTGWKRRAALAQAQKERDPSRVEIREAM